MGPVIAHVNKKDPARSWNVITVTYNRGTYSGVSLDFVHVRAASGPSNEMGSVQIGLIGGLGSIDSENYIQETKTGVIYEVTLTGQAQK